MMTTIVTRGVACWGSEKIAMVITYLKGFFQKWSSNFFLFTKARETSIIFLKDSCNFCTTEKTFYQFNEPVQEFEILSSATWSDFVI